MTARSPARGSRTHPGAFSYDSKPLRVTDPRSFTDPRSRRLPRSLPLLFLLAACSISVLRATPLVGSLQDVTQSAYGGPLNSLQFKPFAVATASGTNTIWPAAGYAAITNGVFGINLNCGWYNVSPVSVSIFGPAAKSIPIFVPNDTNVWQFNQCANLADFMAVNGLTNPVVGLAPGTNVTFTMSNGVTYVNAGGGGAGGGGVTNNQILPGQPVITNGNSITMPAANLAGQLVAAQLGGTLTNNTIGAASTATNAQSAAALSIGAAYAQLTNAAQNNANAMFANLGASALFIGFGGINSQN